jgi:hypothetical protein
MLVYVLLLATIAGDRPGLAASHTAKSRAAIMRTARAGPPAPPPMTRGRRCVHVSVHRLASDAAPSRSFALAAQPAPSTPRR